jgi:alkylation response protein AidB-like acyl-CoA dehydrogenase
MEKIVDKVAALGIPGIVLTVSIGATGLKGAAAITAALAALGPGGMITGIFALGVIGLISGAITKYGTEAVIQAVILRRLETTSAEELKRQVCAMQFISWDLKLRIIGYIDLYATACA